MKKLFITLITVLIASTAFAKKIKEGAAFPVEELLKLKAVESKLSAVKGKVVLVDFWASWCGPCKLALPAYDKLAKKYGKKGFVVVGVNVDDDLTLGQVFLKEHKVSFPIVYDEGKSLVGKLGVETMPTSFLIDKKGRLSKLHQGFREGDETKLQKDIEKLLK